MPEPLSTEWSLGTKVGWYCPVLTAAKGERCGSPAQSYTGPRKREVLIQAEEAALLAD